MNIAPWIFGLLIGLAMFGFVAVLTSILLLFLSLFSARDADEEAEELERIWGEEDTVAFRAYAERGAR